MDIQQKYYGSKNNQQTGGGRHEHPLGRELNEGEKENASNAREQAADDIDADPDLSIHSPNDDLDEGETARLGEDLSDII